MGEESTELHCSLGMLHCTDTHFRAHTPLCDSELSLHFDLQKVVPARKE